MSLHYPVPEISLQRAEEVAAPEERLARGAYLLSMFLPLVQVVQPIPTVSCTDHGQAPVHCGAPTSQTLNWANPPKLLTLSKKDGPEGLTSIASALLFRAGLKS